jgi:hypothetical protein
VLPEPFNADDFTYTWHVSTSTAQGGCPENLNPIGLQNIQDITGAEGGRTVTVTFATPFADWRRAAERHLRRPVAAEEAQHRRRRAGRRADPEPDVLGQEASTQPADPPFRRR